MLLVWKDENVRYLTGLRAQLIAGKTTSLNGAFVTAGEQPVLLGSGGEIDKAEFGMSWIGEAHAVPIMEQRELVDGFVTEILTPILHKRDLESGRLAVDQANISFIQSLQAHLPNVELIDGDTVMQQARWIKTDTEVAVIEEACAIGDSVTQRALDETRAGRRELEVAADAVVSSIPTRLNDPPAAAQPRKARASMTRARARTTLVHFPRPLMSSTPPRKAKRIVVNRPRPAAGTVMSRLSRARSELRARLQPPVEEEEKP